MLKNYLTTALRHLKRRPGYAFINVTGLAVGMACCMLILLFVRDELSYDRHVPEAERVHRVVSDWGDFSIPATNPPVVRNLRADFPEITVATLVTNDALVQYEDKSFREDNIYFGNPEAADVFGLDVLAGTFPSAPMTAALTPEVARKYFGDDDPIGKSMMADGQLPITVVGLVAPLPRTSHLHPDFWVSWATIDVIRPGWLDSMLWGSNGIYTYLRLPEGTSAEAVEAQFPDFIARHAGDNWNGSDLSLQPLTDIHLRSHHNMELEANSNAAYVWVFSAIALFILLIAAVNFMNLATARGVERAREVGVRKAVGADRAQLVRQFLSESVVLSILALVLAIVLTAVALPGFRALSGKALGTGVLTEGFTIAAFLTITLLVGVLAGSYPAFVLSAFRPASVLKGTFRTSKRGTLLRKGLVVFQFTISVVLLVGTFVVYNQLQYLQQANLGFDESQVVVLPVQSRQVPSRFGTFRSQLEGQSGVQTVAISSEGLPSELLNGSGTAFPGVRTDDDPDSFVPTRTVSVGHDFFEALGVEFAAGRAFSRQFASDSSAFILNETAARLLLATEPGRVADLNGLIGETVRARGNEGPLVGIVKDFNMASLHEAIEPIVFFIEPDWYDHFLVRINTADVPGALAAVERAWQTVAPGFPFDYRFADAAFDAQYRAEERLGWVFLVFAALAVFIACLGLFGLASLAAAQRTKEIGVRKVLGASVPGLVWLLAVEFAKLVLVALVVAAPVAYVAMNGWLDGFAYRTGMSLWVFAAAGATALAVALLSVSFQAWRAATTDPVRALRYE